MKEKLIYKNPFKVLFNDKELALAYKNKADLVGLVVELIHRSNADNTYVADLLGITESEVARLKKGDIEVFRYPQLMIYAKMLKNCNFK